MDTDLRKNLKNNSKNIFFKLINNAVFRATMENVTNHRYLKLVTTKARRKYLVSERNYYTTKIFSDNLLATEMKRAQILTNKPVLFSLSILEISKMERFQFWYD